MSPYETTLVIFKPDAVKRGMVGRLLQRFEEKGLSILRMDFRHLPASVVEDHYAEHRDKLFFSDLVAAMSYKPVVVAALEGYRAVEVCRKLVGEFADGASCSPGTIRGDFATGSPKAENLIHASDSSAAAQREIEIFFQPSLIA